MPFLESRRALLYGQYRIVKLQTVEALSTLPIITDVNLTNQKRKDKVSEKNTGDYFDSYFEACNKVKEQEDTNLGVNSNNNEHSRRSKEIDFIMQALCLLPED